MATRDDTETRDMARMQENLQRIEALSQRLIAAMARRDPAKPQLSGPDQALFAKAATSYWQEMLANPAKLMEQQVAYWGKSLSHYAEASAAMAQGAAMGLDDAADEGETPPPSDPRFSNPLWHKHPYFRLIRQQYETNAQAILASVGEVDDMSEKDKRRLRHFAQQIVDMMSPSNFLGTNPDALERALETEGESLVKGLENLVADLEANDGELVVRLADDSAFELGGNIATTPGKVVFRNRMMELIQYEPATKEVREVPLIIFPPWINKFYILDLKAQNSLIRWITEQGYTLFVVSWVNPDESLAEIGLEDYIEEGVLAAVEEVKSRTGQRQVNAVGYCIAGTTLALTLALLKKRGQDDIRSATFFTTLTDFSDQGEFTPFLQDDFIDGIEEEVKERGILRSFIMARTFSFLRARDLVYGPAIRSYMMGEAPPAFDLLYWNGDGSNLPGRMAMQYLRGLCQQNRFAGGEGFKILGEVLHLSEVDVPLCAIACETDHIAAWVDSYRGISMMGAKEKTFILSQSGHIAGIVNPPTKKKYGHYTNPDLDLPAGAWREGAAFHEGSWWPRWELWLRERSGPLVPARKPGDSGQPVLGEAPGDYVKRKAKG